MKAISIRQPWAWLIVNGYKDIENRSWSAKLRGPVLIHASKNMTLKEYYDVRDFLETHCLHDALKAMPAFDQFQYGGIVGSAEITDCVTESASPWFFGKHGFVLQNAKRLPFKEYRGQLGFFEVQP